MTRTALISGLAAAMVGMTAVSSAVFVNLNLDNPDQVAVAGNATTLTYSGSVDLGAGWSVSGWGIEFATTNPSSIYLNNWAFAPTFITYMTNATPGVDYSGDIFTINLSGSEAAGLYAFNPNTGFGADDLLSEFNLWATNGQFTAQDSELYSVDIQAVPEPASMAALMVGAAALVRKRKK